MNLPHLATKLFNVPVAVLPRKAEIVVAALAERLGIASVRGFELREANPFWTDSSGLMSETDLTDRGYDLVGPVAIIQLEGLLVQRFAGALRPESGMTGYNGIRQNFLTALADPQVKGIIFDIDSPGGEVAGCFDLVDLIFAARGTKPVLAIADELACSAAYALASAADEIVVPRTGSIGSIGVVTMHVDWSRALAGAGLEVTFIQYGERKTDGAPQQPLSAEAHRLIQADIDTTGDLFVSLVARNRRLAASAVRAQEAGVFMGEAAVAAGLADRVEAPAAAFSRFFQSLL